MCFVCELLGRASSLFAVFMPCPSSPQGFGSVSIRSRLGFVFVSLVRNASSVISLFHFSVSLNGVFVFLSSLTSKELWLGRLILFAVFRFTTATHLECTYGKIGPIGLKLPHVLISQHSLDALVPCKLSSRTIA